ncbi:hypothetical protein Lepto7375DRAFT_7334 [Leptolyngbya sp. PCC 7375]|nr:hypothetical protein Lepto7375DRAFT_7334 [Leptolyngbya sp. PCC 7375]
MVSPATLSNFDSQRLLIALALFEQTYGKARSDLEYQAILAALITVMDITGQESGQDLGLSIYKLHHDYRQNYRKIDWLERLDQYSDGNNDGNGDAVLAAAVHQVKARLDDAAKTLIFLIRTYLQRISAKLSALDFVNLTKAAIAILNNAQPEPKLSLPEKKRLLYIALQTFGTQLSQPIPPLGTKIPTQITALVTQLVQHQKIMLNDGVKAFCANFIAQLPDNQSHPPSVRFIRTALRNSNVTISKALDTQENLYALASILFFEKQLQIPSPKAPKSAQAIIHQINQAIAQFKANYQSPAQVSQPQWDDELSVSSQLFTANNFETADQDLTGFPQNHIANISKDETNS